MGKSIGMMLRTYGEKQGIGIYSQNLVKEILKQDTQTRYVLFYRDAELLGTYAAHANVEEVLVEAPNKLLWDQVAIPRAARKAGIDLLFHTKFTVPLFSRIPSVMVAHGASWFVRPDLYEDKLDLAYIKAVMPFYCRKATAILANSELTRDDFINILKVPPAKIVTTPLGTSDIFRPVTDAATREAARERYGLPDRYILSVIKYDPRKNFENLIAGYRLLRKRFGRKLVCVGIGCDKYRDEYKLTEDGTADDVTFLGWVDQPDLPVLYSMADCLLFPSVYEEFGIPTCEAMACGCPVVVSNTGALPEISGESGIHVDPFDPAAIAEGLYQMLSDDAQRARRSALAIERARFYRWERCAADTLRVFQRVLDGLPAGSAGEEPRMHTNGH